MVEEFKLNGERDGGKVMPRTRSSWERVYNFRSNKNVPMYHYRYRPIFQISASMSAVFLQIQSILYKELST